MSSRVEELRATYKRMPEEQLLELAGQADQLTGEARTALWAELGYRGITEEAIKTREKKSSRSDPPTADEIAQLNLLGERTPTLPPSEFVAVFSAESESEAEQVQESLRAAGVESQLQIVILVPQAEAEKAFEILSEQLGPDTESDDGEPDEDLDEEIEEEEQDD